MKYPTLSDKLAAWQHSQGYLFWGRQIRDILSITTASVKWPAHILFNETLWCRLLARVGFITSSSTKWHKPSRRNNEFHRCCCWGEKWAITDKRMIELSWRTWLFWSFVERSKSEIISILSRGSLKELCALKREHQPNPNGFCKTMRERKWKMDTHTVWSWRKTVALQILAF